MPSQERIQSIRQWYIDQATNSTKPVAVITFTVTTDHSIQASAIGVDDSIAQAMLPKMEEAVKLLRRQVSATEESNTTVVPLRPKTLQTRYERVFQVKVDGHCEVCHTEVNAIQSHIVPVSQDGEEYVMHLLCPNCHRAMHSRNNLRSIR